MKPIDGPAVKHQECADLEGSGWSDAQIIAKVDGRPERTEKAARPLTRGDIVIGVMAGNLLAALICGVLYLVGMMLNELLAPVPH
jgi:hypothetical protein